MGGLPHRLNERTRDVTVWRRELQRELHELQHETQASSCYSLSLSFPFFLSSLLLFVPHSDPDPDLTNMKRKSLYHIFLKNCPVRLCPFEKKSPLESLLSVYLSE